MTSSSGRSSSATHSTRPRIGAPNDRTCLYSQCASIPAQYKERNLHRRRRRIRLFDTTQQDQKLDAIFAALGDATQRSILMHLASGPTSVNDFAAPYAMSLPAVSKHLKVLERAGLLTREQQGRVHLCRFDPEAIATANGWIEHMRGFWNESLEDFKTYLSTGKGKDIERDNTE